MSMDVTAPDSPRKPVQLRINGKNKAAIDAMVWEGLNRRQAAEKAGLTDHALYVALTKSHVKRYYLDQLDVLRTSERARNFHTLCEVRDQTSNQMARVNAVAALERIEEQGVAGHSARQSPGVTIVIEAPRDAARVIDASRSQTDVADSAVTYQRLESD